MTAFVPDLKILGYLLAEGDNLSAKAAGKSQFFHRIGYTRAEFRLLAEALATHSETAQNISTETTIHGVRKAFRCEMPVAPNGRRYCIMSVWMETETGLRLLTAYPAWPA